MLKPISEEKLAAILAAHRVWLEGNGGERANLRGADLSGAYFSSANLRGADLSGAYFSSANLRGADLRGANLRGAYFSSADLSGADLRGANLRGAYFSSADLRGAYFSSADLSGANLRGANLRGADLRGAVIGKETIVDLPRRATRSDGYEFFLWRCESGFFIQAGCRWLPFSEARKHWRGNTWRKDNDPNLYHESLDILAFFERHIKRERLSTSKES